MDDGGGATTTETPPDLRDIEAKIGRKTPEGLLRWMREDASSLRGDAKLAAAHDTGKETGRKSLDEKIRKLKMEMAHLRSVDVKILQQLLAVHEGIEAVKWLLEERSTLTSRCSSLTSSQYSLGEGPDTSWRGSWSSLQDPNDKLDNISIGSYLDTLADDMDEYCPSSSESVICSTTPLVSEATGASRTVVAAGMVPGVGGRSGTGPGIRAGANENAVGPKNGTDVKDGAGTGVTNAVTATGNGSARNGKAAAVIKSSPHKSGIPKQEAQVRTKESPSSKEKTHTQSSKVNGVLEKAPTQTGSPTRSGLTERLETGQSPKLRAYKNGKIDLDTCKMNGKMKMEYDAHWRWVQSQEDVTFL